MSDHTGSTTNHAHWLFVCSAPPDAGSGSVTGYALNAEDWRLTEVSETSVAFPTYLAARPGDDVLYATNRVSGGVVSAFAVGDSGELAPLNSRSSGGADPSYVSVDAAGRLVFVANYGGGSVAALPVREDGSLGDPTAVVRHTGSSVVDGRQDKPHPHAVVPGPASRFAYVPDLGTDEVVAYRVDPDGGSLRRDEGASVALPPGAGPRHIEFSPSGRRCYLVNELNSTVSVLERELDTGSLRHVESLQTTPEGVNVAGNVPADVHVHPTGRWVFVSNRGHDSIAVFEAHEDGLRAVRFASTRGETPRDIALDPGGCHLVAGNKHSGSVVGFTVDRGTGTLTPTGDRIAVPNPICSCFIRH